jgi:FkbM family methyltransferase
MSGTPFALHHVGGRWGNRPFPILPLFEADFVNVLYEADVDAIDGIYQANRHLQSKLIVIPSCLAEEIGPQTLHVTLNAGGTSILKPGPAFNDRYKHVFGIDFVNPESMRVIDERPLMATDLDSLLAAPGNTYPPPDFLSLDTQGSEYEILKGAWKTLGRHTSGLIVEVEFVELYQRQKRFQDVCDLLDELGFVFVRFLSIGEQSGQRAPLGLRGRGYQAFADALFLRRPERIPATADNARLLENLCFSAIVFGVVELAIGCFERIEPSDSPRSFCESPSYRYELLLNELFDAYRRSPKAMPPAFADVVSLDTVAQLSSSPPDEWPRFLPGLREFDDPYLDRLKDLQVVGDTEFEAVLRRYEFGELADLVNFTRRDQSFKVMTAIERARSAR